MPIYTAIPFPTFQPALRLMSSISNSNPAIVTTTFDHQYKTGSIVRLHIPPGIGMQQADGLTGTISVTAPTIFAIDIDTTTFDPLLSPTGAQVVPVGEINSMLTAATQNVLPY